MLIETASSVLQIVARMDRGQGKFARELSEISRRAGSTRLLPAHAEGPARVIRRARLLDLVDEGEFFGEMAYILGKQQRLATLVATNDILLGEFKPEASARIGLGAQLKLTRGLARNLMQRLALANTRVAG
jgi:hypothetical protein